MEEYIYTNNLNDSDSISDITSSDIVMLNGNNIVQSLDAQYDGINPIPSFTIVKSLSSMLNVKLSAIDEELAIYDAKLSGHMQYLGSFLNGYVDVESGLPERILSGFLHDNLNILMTDTIDKGTMFRTISAVILSNSIQPNTETIQLLSNDYVLFNKDVVLAQTQLSDLDIIRDAQVEIETLSNEVYETFEQISNCIDNKITIDNRISNIVQQSDLSIVKLSSNEYAQLIINDQTLSNALYIVEDNFIDAYGEQIKNLSKPTDLSDATTKQYVDNAIYDLSNECSAQIDGIQSNISELCSNTETLSNDLSIAFNEIDGLSNNVDDLSNAIDYKITINDKIHGNIKQDNLSVIKLSSNEYVTLLTSDSLLSNALYIVEDNFIDAYGEQIKNVAPGTDLSDVIILKQLNMLSNDISQELKKYQLSGDYLIPTDVTISYNDKIIWLSSKSYVTSVDCADFIKDGMLSTAELCGTTLVLTFNTDAGSDPISVEMSSFVDNYDEKITYLSNQIKQINDKIPENTWESGNELADKLFVNSSISNFYAKDETSSAIEIEQALSVKADVISLNDYLPLSGGTIYGDTEVSASELRILSGNYYQSNGTTDGVQNFSYKNAFLQAESVYEVEGKHKDWGIACTGSKGYCILSVISDDNAFKLSGDISMLSATSALTAKYSWAFGSGGDSLALEISSIDIDSSIVSFKNILPAEIMSVCISSEAEMIAEFENGDNALYCPNNPSIGNIVIHNFYGNHAEGGSIKAIGKYTHAEGRATIADMRYSHAEGDRTFAGKMASHAEGQESKAYGYYSHAEGKNTLVNSNAIAAHAEGRESKAYGAYSHAEGSLTHANGENSHAEGYMTYAKGQGSHVAGYQTSALYDYSYVIGYNAYDKAQNQWVWNGNTSETYQAKGSTGTFNVNPVNGISGFYVGLSSLNDYHNELKNSLSINNYYDKNEINILSTNLSIDYVNKINALSNEISSNYVSKNDGNDLSSIAVSAAVYEIKQNVINALSDIGTASDPDSIEIGNIVSCLRSLYAIMNA